MAASPVGTAVSLPTIAKHDSGWHRSIRQARAARMRLGGPGNLTEPLSGRPKGMHWSTYSRLYVEAVRHEGMFLAVTASLLTSIKRQISRS